MTNTWPDIGTADVVFVIGGNPAENHPMGFKHVQKALFAGGAKLMVADPRFTRTAKLASRSPYNPSLTLYTKLRSGTDIPFVNGMVKYVMDNNLYNREYVLSYSNAGFLVNESFKIPRDPAHPGKFSGFTAKIPQPLLTGLGQVGSYSTSTWQYCTYVVGHAKEYQGVNIATDFWDGAGNYVTVTGAGSGNGPGYPYSYSTLSLDPTSADYIENLKADLFADNVLTVADGFSPTQRTVWDHMQDHYQDYDRTTVLGVTGADGAVYDDMCQLYASTGQAGKAACILYAMGTTQHTVGTQNIRAYSTLQILLGNMGLSGGGINAQRGESNVQGSTDHCLLFHILPGYLGVPQSIIAGDAFFDRTSGAIGGGNPAHPGQLSSYVKRGTPFTNHQNELNWWGYSGTASRFKQYFVSLMKTYYWNHPAWATFTTNPASQQAIYDLVPKVPGNCSHMTLFEEMYEGKIKMLFCFGQNPAVAGPNSFKERKALKRLNTLVVSELWETETAAFWRFNQFGQPRTPAEMATVRTEVFLLPAALHLEKDGNVSNSSRWAQWRYKAVDPPGDAMHEIEMLNKLYDAIVSAPNYTPGLGGLDHLTMGTNWYNQWGFGDDPPADFLDGEINGFTNAHLGPPSSYPFSSGDLMASFGSLKDDGTTSAGNWLYTNMYANGVNLSKRRVNTLPALGNDYKGNPINNIPIYPNWAWAWPLNRRIIYNGASLIPNPLGKGGVSPDPWDTTHPVISWNLAGTAWAGDVNDGVGNPSGYGGGLRTPFIMKPEGHCRLHGYGLADGPYPTHYEPLDTLFRGIGNPISAYGAQSINPAINIYEDVATGMIADPEEYPVVATTYRFTEHWQSGAATRHLPWLCELVPDVVAEISQQLAANLTVSNGDWVKITSPRGFMKARALVTNRFEPMNITGIGEVDQVGIFWHWGYTGIATGHSANRLTAHVGDANTRIPEYKAFLCKVEKV